MLINFTVQSEGIYNDLQFQGLEDFCLCMILPSSLAQLFRSLNSQIPLDQLDSRPNKRNGISI